MTLKKKGNPNPSQWIKIIAEELQAFNGVKIVRGKNHGKKLYITHFS